MHNAQETIQIHCYVLDNVSVERTALEAAAHVALNMISTETNEQTFTCPLLPGFVGKLTSDLQWVVKENVFGTVFHCSTNTTTATETANESFSFIIPDGTPPPPGN